MFDSMQTDPTCFYKPFGRSHLDLAHLQDIKNTYETRRSATFQQDFAIPKSIMSADTWNEDKEPLSLDSDCVDGLLEACHNIIEDDVEGDSSSSILEPTPIDPTGIKEVVDEIPIVQARWLQNVTDFSAKHPLFQMEHQRSKTEQWNQRFQELVEFQKEYNHCLVPLNWAPNPPLAHWVKRQRYQYGLKMEGKHSNLTDEREIALKKLGFVWDSHSATWEERWHELRLFKERFGHCNVPSKCRKNPKLSVWVKCQRRQFKLLRCGEKSNMSEERIAKLHQIGFVFDPRTQSRKGQKLNLSRSPGF